MKGKIVALIVGLLLGGTGTAVAATNGIWAKNGSSYQCVGSDRLAACNVRYQKNYWAGVTGRGQTVIDNKGYFSILCPRYASSIDDCSMWDE